MVGLLKIGGSALNLQFTITQIGGTSLPDMLQNALLSGYANVYDSLYFMKIKFMGMMKIIKLLEIFQLQKFYHLRLKIHRFRHYN